MLIVCLVAHFKNHGWYNVWTAYPLSVIFRNSGNNILEDIIILEINKLEENSKGKMVQQTSKVKLERIL